MSDALGSTPLELLAQRSSGETGIPARRVAQEFEALLIGQMMKQAVSSSSSTLDGGSAGRMYRELFLQEVARRMAARGGFGLARTLEDRLQAPPDSAAASENEEVGKP